MLGTVRNHFAGRVSSDASRCGACLGPQPKLGLRPKRRAWIVGVGRCRAATDGAHLISFRSRP